METVDVSEPLRGYLVIHVGGYKRVSNYTAHVFSDGPTHVSVPDRLVPARRHPVGSEEWYEDGWAVGDNPRERFCKWGGASPVYRFYNYDEAVVYIQRLRQRRKRPHETYSLVYFSRGVGGREFHRPVSSLDAIDDFEAELAKEVSENNEAALVRQAAYNAEYPEIGRLKAAFGALKAHRLSLLLKSLRDDGGVEAKREMSKGSFYRGVRELREMGLIK
jgi:hypothetical protein